jgi:predicted benzoate:H+ symporter BenE
MRRFVSLAALLPFAALVAAQSQNPDPSQAFSAVTNAATGYVLSALVAVAVLFGLVLGIRFFMGVARRAVGR